MLALNTEEWVTSARSEDSEQSGEPEIFGGIYLDVLMPFVRILGFPN